MNQNQNQAVLDKIKKLLATASDSGATPNEAAVALRLAQRLMLQNRLTADQVNFHQLGDSQPGTVRMTDFITDILAPNRTRQDSILAQAIGFVCSVGIYSNGASLMGYGLPTDVAVARELFAYVRQHMFDTKNAFCKTRMLPLQGVHARSFNEGFANALYRRARDAKTALLEDKAEVPVHPEDRNGNPMALVVVVGAVAQQHDAELKKMHDHLGLRRARRTSMRAFDHHAFGAGQIAGQSVNLSREVIR